MKSTKKVIITAALLVMAGCSNSADRLTSTEQSAETSEALPEIRAAAPVRQLTAGIEGIEKQTVDAGNLSMNTKCGLCSEFLCAAEGEVFFTNFGDREYLYRVRENGSELVIEMSARCINYYGGRLYFLSSEGTADSVDFSGKMCCIDPETGECELLCDEAATGLTVSGDGIFYTVVVSKNGGGRVLESRVMGFEGDSRKCRSPEFGYGDYLIPPDRIVDLKNEEDITQPSL